MNAGTAIFMVLFWIAVASIKPDREFIGIMALFTVLGILYEVL